MPLDVGFGGDDRCPACGNTGMVTDHIPNVEVQRVIHDRHPDAKVSHASVTRCCDCRHGKALKARMYKKAPDA
jgi:hypothetical protein